MCTCSCQLPFASGSHQHGIVEVARRLAVDGDNRQPAKIAAPRPAPSAAQRLDRLRRADAAASASTFAGKICGRWCLRMTISTSTPKASGGPSTSMMRPRAGRPGAGKSVISTSTASPSSGRCGSSSSDQCSLLRLRLFAQHAMRRLLRRRGNLRALGNQNGLRHALIERRDVVAVDAAERSPTRSCADAAAHSERCRPPSDCAASAPAPRGPSGAHRVPAAPRPPAPRRPASRRSAHSAE